MSFGVRKAEKLCSSPLEPSTPLITLSLSACDVNVVLKSENCVPQTGVRERMKGGRERREERREEVGSPVLQT